MKIALLTLGILSILNCGYAQEGLDPEKCYYTGVPGIKRKWDDRYLDQLRDQRSEKMDQMRDESEKMDQLRDQNNRGVPYYINEKLRELDKEMDILEEKRLDVYRSRQPFNEMMDKPNPYSYNGDIKLIEDIMSKKGYIKLDPSLLSYSLPRRPYLKVPIYEFSAYVAFSSEPDGDDKSFKLSTAFTVEQKVFSEAISEFSEILTNGNVSDLDSNVVYSKEEVSIKMKVSDHLIPVEYFKKFPDCNKNKSKILQNIVDRQKSMRKEHEEGLVEFAGAPGRTIGQYLMGQSCSRAKRDAWDHATYYGFSKKECVIGTYSEHFNKCYGVQNNTDIRYRLLCSHDPQKLKAITKKDLINADYED